MIEPSEMHEAMCPALTGGRCTCERNDPAVDKAWARFCGGIGDGPDAPYPGMISAFERYYSQSFTDKDWRNEASVWAAAWKQALLTAAAPTTQPSTTPQADSQPTPVQDYPPLPESIKYGQLDHSSGAYGYRPQDMRAYVAAAILAARAPADSVTAPAAYSGNIEQELAMLIRRIVSSARRNCEDGSNVLKLANEAWVYLVRKGLNGSPLRDAGIESDPTPAAQAADSVLEDAGGANWQDISTAPKDGTRFVAVGNNYGLYSEMQHTCIAQWFRGCWIEASDWNETSELKYLTHWMPLLPLPGSAARKQGAKHDNT